MLCERVQNVIAIELDDRLYARLKTELAGYSNIELIHGDALEYPYENLPEFTVVANIPYYITTPIIFRLLAARKHLKSMTLTLQKEVIVPRGAFRPVPKVDSAVICMQILENTSVDVKDERTFFRIIKTAFSQRRKMLSNSLRSIRNDTKEWLTAAGIDPGRRPETLSIQEFARLSDMIGKVE